MVGGRRPSGQESVVDLLDPKPMRTEFRGAQVYVNILQQPQLGELHLERARGSGGVPLENAIACPLQNLNRAATFPSRYDEVRVAACVLLQDLEGSVLLMRRATHMRNFPRAWVTPGGGWDAPKQNETLEHAAAREVAEEAGIRISPNDLRLLCLYESVFPTTVDGAWQGDSGTSYHRLFHGSVEKGGASSEASTRGN